MLQENKTDSDEPIKDFAKSRIEREKTRLSVHSDKNEPSSYALPKEFPIEKAFSDFEKVKTPVEETPPAEADEFDFETVPPTDEDGFEEFDAENEKMTQSSQEQYEDREETIVIRYEKATDEEKELYDQTFHKGETAEPFFRIGRKKPLRKKLILVNPKWEKKRARTLLYCRRVVAVLVLLVGFAALITAFRLLSDSHFGDRLRTAFLANNQSDDVSGFVFGPFEGYVTIGDSVARADELLGEPDVVYDSYRYYQNSYLIIEEDTVVGYYRDPSEAFPVTVGFKGENAAGRVMVGDRVKSVVYRLGSPEFCFGKNWLYLSCNGTARSDEVSDTNFEVDFNDDGIVVACYEVKR